MWDTGLPFSTKVYHFFFCCYFWDCAFQVRNMKQLATLQGSIDLILAAASASDKPELRSEEIAFKKHCKVVNSDKAAPSESVLSWEKTLIHNIT